MRKELFKLNELCRDNDIEYMVTGTVALSMLGVSTDFAPADIDIKVFHITEEQRHKLSELQSLSCLENDHYENSECYSFFVGNVKINALISNIDDAKVISGMKIWVSLEDENKCMRFLPVQKAIFAIRDKMKLKRPKDYKYMYNLIHNLTEEA